jgi:hypothetical protein
MKNHPGCTPLNLSFSKFQILMKQKFILYIILLITVITLNNCTTDNEVAIDPTKGLIKLQEGYALGAGTKVELWAKENFFAGYNTVTTILYDSVTSKKIESAQIRFYPEMSMMGGMKHGCPVENPLDEAVNTAFSGAIEYIMPTSDQGTWKLNVDVLNKLNNKNGKASFNVTVNNPMLAKMKSFLSASNEKIFVSYNFPEKMKVGINSFDVVIYKMASAYEFVPVNDYSIVLTPEMPSMGHGSPNNVNPTFSSNGHYTGKVNYTMTGDWRLNLSLSQSGTLVKELYFDVVVE